MMIILQIFNSLQFYNPSPEAGSFGAAFISAATGSGVGPTGGIGTSNNARLSSTGTNSGCCGS